MMMLIMKRCWHMLSLKGCPLVMIMAQHLLQARSGRKQKKRDSEEEGLIAAFKSVGDTLSSAIEKVATGDTDVPDDLFDSLINLPGFEQTHISLYFNYLVAHPHIARAFNKLPFDHKLIWARNFVSEKFPGV
ncbi:hypothetical protein Zm00014a_010894 [Zea mays]|uniref:Uncharacterized protein n=1 Tax=Zea mays TaxID=4577 RepID=A0A3L6DWN8_MAIZE|nr:hypothetical protein Zm00014a_010894 [Zea mays]PWZ13135.1 hypothetical protein Zm00014a_010894 [Zea mays]PWZ13136.1 hypothetical protein Zm00014a_010894 [Zea mays]